MSPAHRGAPLPSAFNDSQRRAILFGMLDVHRRMADMEAMLVQAQDPSPFSEYVNDLSPTEAKVVRDYFSRVRNRMLASVQDAGVPLEIRRTSLRWALQVNLTALNVAVADMGPARLRGYGPLDEAG